MVGCYQQPSSILNQLVYRDPFQTFPSSDSLFYVHDTINDAGFLFDQSDPTSQPLFSTSQTNNLTCYKLPFDSSTHNVSSKETSICALVGTSTAPHEPVHEGPIAVCIPLLHMDPTLIPTASNDSPEFADRIQQPAITPLQNSLFTSTYISDYMHVASWNIAGLKSKMSDLSWLSFMNSFDIILFQET